MMFKKFQRQLPALMLVSSMVAGLVGCAQQVGDIDRTQPNKLKKADFEGTWYMRQTVSDVPATNAFFFTGLSTGLEKMSFEITEGSLIGYRSYELVPGADPGANSNGVDDTQVADTNGDGIPDGRGYNDETYKGSPVVAYSISSHFDVQRSYNASTGEQTNVIVENTSDRYWNDREYMRVNWSSNQLSSISLFDTGMEIQHKRWYGDEDPDAQTFIPEYNEKGELVYFEFTTRAIILPSYACYYYALADCGPTEVSIVSSFAKVPEKQTYEAVEYDNVDMFKFGYFRTERVFYDRERGLRRTGQIFLPNRHKTWETAYAETSNWDGVSATDRDGNPVNEFGQLLDDEGRLVPMPLSEREVKPVVYYLNQEMPEDLWEYNAAIGDDWDRAFTRAAAAGKRVDPSAIEGKAFVVCHNPVRADDDKACGEPGLEVRVGDVRYNHIYWVAQPQLQGPLGYGPSAADPETGEIISGTAYVYGASVDTYAASSLDIIKLATTCLENGQDSPECQDHVDEITSGLNVRADLLERLFDGIDPRAGTSVGEMAPELTEMRIPEQWTDMLDVAARSKVNRVIEDPQPYDAGFERRQLDRIRENSLDLAMLDSEMIRSLTGGQHTDIAELDDEQLEAIRPASWLSPTKLHRLTEARTDFFAKHNVMHADFVDDVVAGLAVSLAREFQNLDPAQRDEAMYRKLRGLIYRGVMAHEIGHTVGLRHNFQGSYDSLNYFDDYWRLRKETLIDVQFVDDLYTASEMTQNQILGVVVDENGEPVDQLPGGMAEYGYSSIMDYGLRFNTDFQGIGKYDEAAIIYAYTTGFDGKFDGEGKRVIDSGYVETWPEAAFADAERDGDALLGGRPVVADLIRDLDFRQSLAYTHLLEGFHYTTIANLWGNVDNLKVRELVKFDEIRAARDADDEDRPVEVPYMFCTDDWVGADSSCHRWDHGADPFEQARYVINAYRDYYWFNNFARDSLQWSAFSIGGRTYSRYLSYLTNIYQQLFFGGDYDGIQSTYRFLAASAGLNLVSEIMTMPNYGDHVYDKDGVLVHCFDSTNDPWCETTDGNFQGLCSSTRCERDSGDHCACEDAIEDDPNGTSCFLVGRSITTRALCYGDEVDGVDIASNIDVEIAAGQGRYPFSRFDYNSGYTYYRYPTEAGHFYDYLAAVQAMISSQAQVFGVDVAADTLSYSLPYNLVFGDEVNQLFNSIWLEKPGLDNGPILMDGQVRARPLTSVSFGSTRVDPLTGEPVDAKNIPSSMAEGSPIQPYHSWGSRYYALLYGMAFFSSNLDLEYADNNQIFRLGNGEQVEPADGFELITCNDPFNGFVYGALHRTNNVNKSAGAQMVERCQYQADRMLEAQRRLRVEEAEDYANDLENTIGLINQMRSFYDIFGSL